jgi:hypothetical protein
MEEVGGEQQQQRDPAATRGAHAPALEDPLMKPLLVDRIWGAMEPGGVDVYVERPPKVSRSDLKKIRSENFKILEEP